MLPDARSTTARPRARPATAVIGALISGAALAAVTAGCGGRAVPSGPNVLLVTIDTLRADHLGAYGYDRPTSPRLDAFAEGATVFESAWGSSSWTLPGLATVLTSHYTSTTGVWRPDSALPPSFHTLAEVLRDAGWDTAGVASQFFQGAAHGLDQGFVHYDDELMRGVSQSADAITSPQVTAKGLRFLELKAASPDERAWLLWLHYFDPHASYRTHEGVSEIFGTRSPVDRYDGEIRFTDRHVGQILDAVDRLGFRDDTICIVTSDHGEEFGDHGGIGHGHTLYEELVRAPLIVRAPGFEPRRVATNVRTVDVLPTILHLADVAPPGRTAGRSLVPLMRSGDGERRLALAELRDDAGDLVQSLVSGHHKLLLREGRGPRLFDLEADPAETRNLASDRPDLVARLREELRAEVRRAEERGLGHDDVSKDLLPSHEKRIGDLGYGDGGVAADELQEAP